jgi:GNAT superfamily N-acetyltransferase
VALRGSAGPPRETKGNLMALESVVEDYPKTITLKGGSPCVLRPLEATDEFSFHEFFLAVPLSERLFIKHPVTDPELILQWCQHIDLGHNFPLLALGEGQVIGDATLHQQLGGWKRHIGRISLLVHPRFRRRGLARALVTEIIHIARHVGLEKVEAEFFGEQEPAIKMFALLGFSTLVRLPQYVKDMETIAHDYVLMGLDLKTDEEYAGMG